MLDARGGNPPPMIASVMIFTNVARRPKGRQRPMSDTVVAAAMP